MVAPLPAIESPVHDRYGGLVPVWRRCRRDDCGYLLVPVIDGDPKPCLACGQRSY